MGKIQETGKKHKKPLEIEKKWPKYHLNYLNSSPIRALAKTSLEFQKIWLKTGKLAKNAIKKLKKPTKNHNETPEIYSNWIQLVNATLRSIPNACYVAKNGSERTKKGQKLPKIATKKKEILFVKIPPSENVFYAFSPVHLVDPWKTT